MHVCAGQNKPILFLAILPRRIFSKKCQQQHSLNFPWVVYYIVFFFTRTLKCKIKTNFK